MGHLGLLDDDGRPRVLPVTYAIHEQAVWTAIDNKPKASDRELARVRWLRERPSAAFTVDRYEDDWPRLCWVQLIGTVSVIEGRPEGPRPGRAVEALSAVSGRPPTWTAAQALRRAGAVVAGGLSKGPGLQRHERRLRPQRHQGRRRASATWAAGTTSSARCSARWSRCSHNHTP